MHFSLAVFHYQDEDVVNDLKDIKLQIISLRNTP